MKISLCLIHLNDRPYKYLWRNYIFERIMILRNTIQTFKQEKVFILSVLMMVLDAQPLLEICFRNDHILLIKYILFYHVCHRRGKLGKFIRLKFPVRPFPNSINSMVCNSIKTTITLSKFFQKKWSEGPIKQTSIRSMK